MEPSSPLPVLDGLVVEAVEWLPSGADAGLVRVRGRWAEPARREAALPALGVRRGGELRQFESLPDARFGRDPSVWRGTYLVPAALMADPAPELWLAWESGARSGLPAPARGFEPAPAPEPPAAAEPGGEVIDRGVLAERRARRAEAAEREQARRAAEALKALEVLELRSSELERRLEALQSAPGPEVRPELAEAVAPAAVVAPPPAPPEHDPAREQALAAAVADVRRLRGELDDQRSKRRKAELLRAADAVALAAAQRNQQRATELETALAERSAQLADAVARAEQAAEQVALARARAAADAAAVRARATA
ncbi:MAG TPA: hypothetical protein VE526_18220, partial [Solirubrobacteraceae bacterium]|nr:hypothetical protein [Solirubrobacteraceae bacterium]